MIEPSLQAYLSISAILLLCGLLCMATKRNTIGMLMGVELILTASTLNLVAFSHFSSLGLDAQIFALFIILLAAGEAAIALAIALNFYNNFQSIDADEGNKLKG